MATVHSMNPVKCERVDFGGTFYHMRIEYVDGGYSWYVATLTGFKNIHEVYEAERVAELEEAYVAFKAKDKYQPLDDEGSLT